MSTRRLACGEVWREARTRRDDQRDGVHLSAALDAEGVAVLEGREGEDAKDTIERLEQVLVREQREDMLPQRVLHVRLGQHLRRLVQCHALEDRDEAVGVDLERVILVGLQEGEEEWEARDARDLVQPLHPLLEIAPPLRKELRRVLRVDLVRREEVPVAGAEV